MGRHVAVGTPITERPRTDPDVRLSRIRLLPRVADGESLVRPGVDDKRFWEVVGRELYHSGPSESALLAAAIEYPLPAFDDLEPERPYGMTVGRHRVIVEIAADDSSQPFPLDRGSVGACAATAPP